MIGYNEFSPTFLSEFNKMSNVVAFVPIMLAVLETIWTKRRYVVAMQTGRSTRWKSNSPAAAWYVFLARKFWVFRPVGG
jgi:hypothetical protein